MYSSAQCSGTILEREVSITACPCKALNMCFSPLQYSTIVLGVTFSRVHAFNCRTW